MCEAASGQKTLLFIQHFSSDGACSGNPGAGGWGCVVVQNEKKLEACAARAETTNNEMELTAIKEALDFWPNLRAYVVIESDSEGCLKMMLGKGEQWIAENCINLADQRVKNQELVNEITLRLRTLNAEFRKVKGHNNDQ
jgi:ribonuclease HI